MYVYTCVYIYIYIYIYIYVFYNHICSAAALVEGLRREGNQGQLASKGLSVGVSEPVIPGAPQTENMSTCLFTNNKHVCLRGHLMTGSDTPATGSTIADEALRRRAPVSIINY